MCVIFQANLGQRSSYNKTKQSIYYQPNVCNNGEFTRVKNENGEGLMMVEELQGKKMTKEEDELQQEKARAKEL